MDLFVKIEKAKKDGINQDIEKRNAWPLVVANRRPVIIQSIISRKHHQIHISSHTSSQRQKKPQYI